MQIEKNPRVKQLRILLIAANAAAVAVLMAIPIGKIFGMVEEKIDAAAAFGWLVFFVPLLASALALGGILSFRPALTRLFVMIAMPGSFLMAFVSVFIFWRAPSDFAQIGIGAAVLLGLNVLALWKPFIMHVKSLPLESREADHNN